MNVVWYHLGYSYDPTNPCYLNNPQFNKLIFIWIFYDWKVGGIGALRVVDGDGEDDVWGVGIGVVHDVYPIAISAGS